MAKLRLISKLAFILPLLNLLVVLIVILSKDPQMGFYYHFSAEPDYYKALFYVNLPALLIAGLAVYPFVTFGVMHAPGFLYLSIFIIASFAQWSMVGYSIDLLWKRLKHK